MYQGLHVLRAKRSIEYGSRKWELIKGLSIQDTDRILDKNRYSAFFGTDLDESLRSRGIFANLLYFPTLQADRDRVAAGEVGAV